MHSNAGNRFSNVMSGIAPNWGRRPFGIIAAAPFFMGIAAIKFQQRDVIAAAERTKLSRQP